jgi:3-hydroxyisobutyrate dehydrogenase
LSGKFGAGFSLGLMAKDVRIAKGLSDAMTGGMAQSTTTESLWDEAEALLGGDADFTAAYKAWDK